MTKCKHENTEHMPVTSGGSFVAEDHICLDCGHSFTLTINDLLNYLEDIEND